MTKDKKNIKQPDNDSKNLATDQSLEEEISMEETSVEGAVVEETPEEETAVEGVPEEETSVEEAVVEETPEEETAVEEIPLEDTADQSLDIPFIIGKKIGMTRLFDNDGQSYPVTLVQAGPCYVTQIKSKEKDGYSAVQIGYLEIKQRKLNKPKQGHLKNIKDKYLKYLRECRIDNISDNISIGGEINVKSFDIGDVVNVSGESKGKGFAGHMKRYNFSGGRASHGKNSVMRKAGSVGAGTSPGKVWKGTRMAGRMGNDTVTVQNLEVIKINNNENTIFLNGSIPGSKNSIVYISKAL